MLRLLFLLLTLAIAQPLPPTLEPPLRVGVTDLPPFTYQEDGFWQGIAVDLWAQVASELNLTYDLLEVEQENVPTLLANGVLDIVISGQARPEAGLEYTHIYYRGTLGVATRGTRGFGEIARGLLTVRFWQVVLWLSVLLFIVGLIMWLLERQTNEEQFGGERSVIQGIGSGFWWAGVTMTTIGYGDKAPVTFWGRVVALLWMLVAMGITASLTAAIVSVVGVGQGGGLRVPGELREMQVGSLEGSSSARYLDEQEVVYEAYSNVRRGLRAVQRRDLDAFVYTVPGLRYALNREDGLGLQVQTQEVDAQLFAFALPTDSPLRDPINEVLLRYLTTEGWLRLLDHYIPEGQGQ